MPNLKTFFPEGVKVKIANEVFVIKPFVLRKRTEVLRIIAEVILDIQKEVPALGKNPKDIDIKKLPMFIQLAGDKLVDLYVIVLGKDKEWLLDNVQMADELKILSSIAKVNDLPFLWSQIKMLLGAVKTQTKP
jgi:hypothetical protein